MRVGSEYQNFQGNLEIGRSNSSAVSDFKSFVNTKAQQPIPMLRVHHKNQKVKLEGSKIDLIIQQRSNARKHRAFNNIGSS